MSIGGLFTNISMILKFLSFQLSNFSRTLQISRCISHACHSWLCNRFHKKRGIENTAKEDPARKLDKKRTRKPSQIPATLWGMVKCLNPTNATRRCKLHRVTIIQTDVFWSQTHFSFFCLSFISIRWVSFETIFDILSKYSGEIALTKTLDYFYAVPILYVVSLTDNWLR